MHAYFQTIQKDHNILKPAQYPYCNQYKHCQCCASSVLFITRKGWMKNDISSLYLYIKCVYLYVSKMCNYTLYYYKYNLQSISIFHNCVTSQCNTVLRHRPAAVYMPTNFKFKKTILL